MQSPLSADLQAILRCLSCGSKLDSDQAGGYVCPACKRAYPNVNGIARFVDAQHYAASFGFQWHRYQKTQLDHDELRESDANFLMKTALRPEDLKGKLVLDVGCGMGRFAEVATRWGARVVGIDLSAAAEVAAKNLADRDFVAFQADVFALPFAPESFDIIYSIGVLHHTPDCEAAVKALDKYLKPGGLLVVWLYSGYNKWYRFSDFWRRYTHKMKPRDSARHPESRGARSSTTCSRCLKKFPLVGRPVAGLIHHVFPGEPPEDPRSSACSIPSTGTRRSISPSTPTSRSSSGTKRWAWKTCAWARISIAVRGRKPCEMNHTGVLVWRRSLAPSRWGESNARCARDIKVSAMQI